MTALTTALLHSNGKVPIDQSSRILSDGLEKFIVTVGGTGSPGYNGDEIAATITQIDQPHGISVDGKGNVYFSSQLNHRVRKVTASTGIITTIAGTGSAGYNGDVIMASSAQLNNPHGVAVDGPGNVYLTDLLNQRVRKVTASTGIITTIAGTGSAGYNGDGIVASNAQLYYPHEVAVDVLGNVYISDTYNHRVRKVTVSTGIISTIAGTGQLGYSGDGIMAARAKLNSPNNVAADVSGNIYITDTNNHRVRKVTVSTGIISTIAGTGYGGYNGDGIMATSAKLYRPEGIAINGSGDVYIADTYNYRIRLLTSVSPTASPSTAPSVSPTACPTDAPSMTPTACPTDAPSMAPTSCPTDAPSM